MLSTPIKIKKNVDVRTKTRHFHHSEGLGFDYNFAFQPIVDIQSRTIVGHEALVRGSDGSAAETVLHQVTDSYRFDQACHFNAIKKASEANLQGFLSINFMPNAVKNPTQSLLATLEACDIYNFPTSNIIFEFNEKELIEDPAQIVNIGNEYKQFGFKTAVDDFGAGYAGLNFIATFQPDIIKIDMHLIRGIDQSKSRQAIIKAVVRMCEELHITIIAEGIETAAERDMLASYGIRFFQGYLFCKPSFQAEGVVSLGAWA